MQYVVTDIGKVNLSSTMRICLKEHAGSVVQRNYLIEVKEYGSWVGKDKSYIKNMNIDEQINPIERWIKNFISTNELRTILTLAN